MASQPNKLVSFAGVKNIQTHNYSKCPNWVPYVFKGSSVLVPLKIFYFEPWVTSDFFSMGGGDDQQICFDYSRLRSRDSSVGIATGYGLDDQGEREFESR
jgi:hypothetical protein